MALGCLCLFGSFAVSQVGGRAGCVQSHHWGHHLRHVDMAFPEQMSAYASGNLHVSKGMLGRTNSKHASKPGESGNSAIWGATGADFGARDQPFLFGLVEAESKHFQTPRPCGCCQSPKNGSSP